MLTIPKMKKLMLLALAVLAWSCGKVEDSREYKELLAKYDSVVAISSGRAGENAELNSIISEIEANLDSVSKDQDMVSELNKEGYENQKEKIDAMITGINSYMEKNKAKMVALEKKVKKSGKANSALQKMVENLKKQIIQKEEQLVAMQSTIQGLEVKVGELNQTVAVKDQEIAAKTEEISKKDNELVERQKTIDNKENELTTGYIAYGSKKELAEKGIIKKEGGVLGMGKVLKLSDRPDNTKFRKINIKTLSEIRLGMVKKKKMVSSHPDNSYYYTISGEEVFIKITDYNKFWSLTKYCVIEVD
jgi:predicted  nucleic acid-binding Zn-ribbon protein